MEQIMDIEIIKAEAKAEVDDENAKIVKKKLKKLYKNQKDAELITKNIKLEIKDLEMSIADGTFDPDAA